MGWEDLKQISSREIINCKYTKSTQETIVDAVNFKYVESYRNSSKNCLLKFGYFEPSSHDVGKREKKTGVIHMQNVRLPKNIFLFVIFVYQ